MCYNPCMKSINRITVDPKIMTGKPVIAGTRIPVEIVLEKLAQNIDIAEILQDYPRLTEDDIKAAVYYAKSVVNQEEFYPLMA